MQYLHTKRLKRARNASGLSLRELSKHIGNLVTAQAIGKYERGESFPKQPVLEALARALGVSEDYLLDHQVFDVEEVEFRKKGFESRREEERVRARVERLFEGHMVLEAALDLKGGWDEPRDGRYPVNANLSEADLAASYLREHWSLGDVPILNMVEALEQRGVKVLEIEGSPFDGLAGHVSRKDRRRLPVIVINKEDWAERKRFSLARELGHMILEVRPELSVDSVAQRFARAFLMPAESLRSEVGKRRTSMGLAELLWLKEHFGASCQTITDRCKELGIFRETLHRHLYSQFTRLGWRSSPYKEHGDLPPDLETPHQLLHLCYRAVSEGAVTVDYAAQLLGTPAHELARRMSW